MRSCRKICMFFSVMVLILSILFSVSFSESINIPSISEATDDELQDAINIILSEQKSRIKSSLSFANQNESVSKGKTIKLEACAYDLPEDAKELSCTWESSDTSIASVKDGTVKGIDAGKATIKCVKTYSDGLELEASCNVSVEVPIKKLSVPKSITVGVNKSVTIDVGYTPQNATNTEFEFITSDKKIANVNSKGKVTGVSTGSCTITVISKDPDAAKATVKVKVNSLYSEKNEYTITEKTGLVIDLQCWGSSADKIDITNESKKLFSVTEAEYNKSSGKLSIHLSPIKAGKGKLSIKDANSKESISLSITVSSSSVYDSTSYPKMDYKAIMRNPTSYLGKKISFRGEVSKKFDMGDGMYLCTIYTRRSYGVWIYDEIEFIIADSTVATERVLEDDVVTVYGTVFSDESYLENVLTGVKNQSFVVLAEKVIVE